MIRSLMVLVALGVFAGAVTPARAVPAASRTPSRQLKTGAGLARGARASSQAGSELGNRIVTRARQLVGVHSLHAVDQSVPDDCTGLVRLAYAGAGIRLMDGEGFRADNGVTYLFRRANRLGALHSSRPKPGDIVFFRETYDRNRDGRRDDGLTHVAIVERVEPGGQLTLIHRGSKGVARTRMNLQHPATHRANHGGEVANDYLRRASANQRAYVTGELFAGFASPEPWARARRSAPGR